MSIEYMPVPEDKELAALNVIVTEMEKLKDDQRGIERVLDYVRDRYDSHA